MINFLLFRVITFLSYPTHMLHVGLWGLQMRASRHEGFIFYYVPNPRFGMQALKKLFMSLDFENIEMLHSFSLIVEKTLSQWFLS